MRLPAGAAALVVVLAIAACSDADDTESSGRGSTTTTPATVPAGDAVPATVASTSAPAPDPTGAPAATETTAATEPSTTFAVVDVPETGVPGLDSADSFCAAWSRFGGSWQVIQVAANFAPDPSVVPAIEVAAAPVVDGAYEQMFAAWPDELADERDVVADGFFGPLERRAEAALEALGRAGADDDDLAALGAAWIEALADRQPDDPVVTPILDDELRSLVDAAAADFSGQRVDFVDDPSMRITAETPRTDAYLATACPDQGALTGTEVDGG